MIWADDPADRLVPTSAHAAGPAGVRKPGDDRARRRRPVRGDAVPRRPRPADAAVQPARVLTAAGGRGREVRALRPAVLADRRRPGRVQGAQRQPRAPGRATGRWRRLPSCSWPAAARWTASTGSAATSSRWCSPRWARTRRAAVVERMRAAVASTATTSGWRAWARASAARRALPTVTTPTCCSARADTAMYAAKTPGAGAPARAPRPDAPAAGLDIGSSGAVAG